MDWRQTARPPRVGIYERIGVRPLINCKGTYTIIGGSQMLPEVRRAMDAASRRYVHLDELMEAVAGRLAELTRAEWGIVTSGCAAALAQATAACIAGGDPERMARLPDLAGMKNEAVIPSESRNEYDHAVRMTGVRIITPAGGSEFFEALRPSTAVVVLLGEALSRHPLTLEEMAAAAHRRGIPVLVDAAAERPTIPDVYLGRGADLTAYSGGKCLRGPQAAGLLLGRKDLVRAAWLNGAPHHGFGRPMKAGREEVMGMLAAVEAWSVRDHEAEWREWECRLETIRRAVAGIPGVRTEKLMPEGPSNYAPRLRITFDGSGSEAAGALFHGDPRIVIHYAEDSLTVMPYMMMPGEDAVAAERIAEVLRHPPHRVEPEPSGYEGSAAGVWQVEIEFVYGSAAHVLELEEEDGRLGGRHRGSFLEGEVKGARNGSRVVLAATHTYEGSAVMYRFAGVLAGDAMSGAADLDEYGAARFTARRQPAT